MINGLVAVVLFFMISGFLMAVIINEKYTIGKKPSWVTTFYVSRLWRLFPAYWATLAFMVVWFIGTDGPNPFTLHTEGSMLKQVLLMFPNLLIVGQDWHQFLTRVVVEQAGPQWMINLLTNGTTPRLNNMQMAVGHAWSLSAEICFYAVAPFILVSRRTTFIVAGAALLFRFLLIMVFEQRGGIWGYYWFPGNFCMFMLGATSYHLHKMLPPREYHRAIGATALACFIAWLAIFALKDGVILESPTDWSIDRPRFWILYILFAASIPFVFTLTKDVDRRIEGSSRLGIWSKVIMWDRELGDLSYSLYLIHGIVVGLIYYRWNAPRGMYSDMIMAVFMCLVAAYILNRFVEQPAEALRRRWADGRLRKT
ncbi:hypothetical protein ASF29_19940 [Rhizobium sp. Leaf262]|nr:hypothetical protein ASF29_19940 [Rhizobium sp. Leaf262]